MYPVPRAGNMQLAATTSKRIARKRKWGGRRGNVWLVIRQGKPKHVNKSLKNCKQRLKEVHISCLTWKDGNPLQPYTTQF